MKTFISACTIALMATSSFAGDWTAGYAGLGVGYGDVDLSAGLPGGNNSIYGIHGGYDYDMGDWVIGSELEYARTNIDVGNGASTLDNVFSLKVKFGYDFGPALGYALVGGTRAYTNNIGNDTGGLYGLGLAYQVNPQWTISGEYVRHYFDDFNNSGIDVDADAVSLRASFRF